MAKPTKSQWDFGELFPTEAVRKVLTVGELTFQVKQLLESRVGHVWVTGEVTNLRAQSSGHIYFTLKDADSQLNCVLFRNEAPGARALLQDGRQVVLEGNLTVYEPRGQYQLRVTSVELRGVGVLQAAFEKLKQKLNAEGLFAQERKRPLPERPHHIGIVTSPTGAAIRDILHVVQRRNPTLEMVLVPCRVQGDSAAQEIADGIRLLNGFSSRTPNSALDLILITRGGGSLEDLWAFNEEVVARAIFESALPIVSAVGHEIDFTISDFVADVRAATPSAGAEIITEGVYSTWEFVLNAHARMSILMRRHYEDKFDTLALAQQRLLRNSPRRRFNEYLQRWDDLRESLLRCACQGIRDRQVAWRNIRDRLLRLRPVQLLAQRRELARETTRLFSKLAAQQLRDKQNRLAVLGTRLRLLGPEQVLARGYSITMRADNGKVIRAASEVKAGMKLRTRLKSGEIHSTASAREDNA